MKRLILAVAICLLPLPALAAVSWSAVSHDLVNLRCGNYCDIVEHDGALISGDSNNGSIATGDVWISRNGGGISSSFGSPVREIPRSVLQGYYDNNGDPMTYTRTVGLASEGGTLHALLHVGAIYGVSSGYYYVPAYARSTDAGRNWQYLGPVTVDGQQARYIFSSSMAYAVRNGVHWMIQDAGAYGCGSLCAYRSADGRNWARFDGEISAFTSDAPAFPDLAFFNGRWHLTYVRAWNDGRVRHLSSADMRTWTVENSNAMFADKSVNIFANGGRLYAHRRGKLWRADITTSKPPPSGSVCSAFGLKPCATLNGSDVAVTWQATGMDSLKSVPLDGQGGGSYRNISDGNYNYRGLGTGRWRIRVRDNSSSAYSNIEVAIGDGSPSPSPRSGSALNPKVRISGHSATVTWSGPGTHSLKLVGPTSDYRDVSGNSHTYNNLPSGNYIARVRVKGSGTSGYENAEFTR